MRCFMKQPGFLLTALVLLVSCKGEGMMENAKTTSIRDIPDAVWKELGEKKIYFGHQSVGFNIMEGVKDLMKENPNITLNIVDTADAADFVTGVFAHSRVGQNTDAGSKTEAFAEILEEGVGDKADTAFFKFCYVDIDAGTDARKMFTDYTKTMTALREAYPATTLVHVTVPLGTSKTTWRTWLKKLTGKDRIWEYDDNVKRNEFNELLRKEYDGKETVFDLAGVESTFPDGKRASFTKGGKTYFSLVPGYTNDGGHLNEAGRKKVAEQLLILLANLSAKSVH